MNDGEGRVEWVKAYVKAQHELPVIKRDKTVEVQTKTGGSFSYCVDPGMRILTADLRWIDAEKLSPGDGLIGFDEHRPGRQQARRWRTSEVEATDRVRLSAYRIYLEDGTELVASATHSWLTMVSEEAVWCDTEDLVVGYHRLIRAVDVWEEEGSWATGYLAAAFDGEGSLTQTPVKGRRSHQLHLVFAQRSNAMSAMVDSLAAHLGFDLRRYGKLSSDVSMWRVTGGRAEVLRFLGMVRPRRLLPQLDIDRLGDFRKVALVPVVGLESLGETDLVALQTTTRTFVAEGFASHNSYADLASILEAVRPVLIENELAIAQEVTSDVAEGIGVITHIYHSGGYVESFGPMYLYRTEDPQDAGSAITYARRYALTAALGLATETDDDARMASRAAPERPPIEITDPHCPACLNTNGELVPLDKTTSPKGKVYWRCSNRGRDCAGWTSVGEKVYSLSLWVEVDDNPDDWKALSDRWLRSKGVFPLTQDSVGPEVVLYVRDQVLRTTGTEDEARANEVVLEAVAAMLELGLLEDEILKKGDDFEDVDQKLKVVAMAIPYRLSDEWIANASAILLDQGVPSTDEEE